MRKICVFICVVMLLLLIGCKEDYITPITKGIGFTAHISYYNEKYTANVTVDEKGLFTLAVTEPEILGGIQFIFDGNSAKAEIGGIEYVPDKNNTQFFGVADKFYWVFADIEGKNAVYSDGNYEIQGLTKGEEYEITFGKSGLPLSLEIDENIYVIVSNAKIL